MKPWARLHTGLLIRCPSSSPGAGTVPRWLEHLGTGAGAASRCTAGGAQPVGSAEKGSDHLDWLCPPRSPHLRARFLNHYLPFPQPFGFLTFMGLLNLQPGIGQGTSGPPSLPLGMESAGRCGRGLLWGSPCTAVWKKHSDECWSPRRAVTALKELQLILQLGDFVECLVCYSLLSIPREARSPPFLLSVPPLAARPARSMNGRQTPVLEPATKHDGNGSAACRGFPGGLRYLISTHRLDIKSHDGTGGGGELLSLHP